MASRRAFLGAAVLAATASGCSSSGTLFGVGPTVRVAVSWSGKELQAFRSVVDGLQVRDYRIELIPFGDEIAAAFHTTPRLDVVMLPQPGLVKAYTQGTRELDPLPAGAIAALRPWPDDKLWRDLLFQPDEHDVSKWYGVPFKIANKSSVWYRKTLFAEYGLSAPERWSDWLTLNRDLRNAGITPLALAGADGWMLTDFFENVLLGCDPRGYDELAGEGSDARLSAEPTVARALGLLGRMWAPQGTLAGGVKRSLVQQFSDAVVEVFGHHRAAMVVAPDFAEPIVRTFAVPDDVGIFTFPAVDGDDADPVRGGGVAPLVVGGDVAVLTTPASDSANDLVARLAGPQASGRWIGDHLGFLAANQHDPSAPYSAELRELANQLLHNARSIRFDLSDQLGPLGGSEGLWQVLQLFLQQVGERGKAQVPAAVSKALDRLRQLEGARDRLQELEERNEPEG